MTLQNKDTIFGMMITIAEKLENSKLKRESLDCVQPQIKRLSEYLGTDEMASIFFSVIFVIQNQRSQAVNLHDIAEFLDYSFLYILEYRKNIDELERKNLIYMDDKGKSKHSLENGFRISEIVMNCVIDGEPIVHYEKEKLTDEQIIEEILYIQKNFNEEDINDSEYESLITKIEKGSKENEIIQNIIKLFPNDMDSRLILYYFFGTHIYGEECLESEYKRNRSETAAFSVISGRNKWTRRKSMLNRTDILITSGILKSVSVKGDDYRRGRLKTFRFTPEGHLKVFGSKAEKYPLKENFLTDTDKALNFLCEFADCYENSDIDLFDKLDKLWDIEENEIDLPFVMKIKELIPDGDNRFFFYDCVNDFVIGNGGKSSLTRSLNDLYGHTNKYFSELRSFLDEKHPLIEKEFLQIEKDEKIENTTLTVTDKTIELLYGENADLYIKTATARNVLVPKDLKEKKLFYSEQVQKQISMLGESLVQKNLEAMQKRLTEKGLPKGIAAIFYGYPGTGKTETVYQLAKQTDRKIFHVDIAESKSMWFGESEKRIKKIFTDYRQLCKSCRQHHENTPILLFNEADALISRRKNVSSENVAQTENAMQNILLEEMEKLDGIMIATTNLCDNMDKAFERRFLFKVKYEKPNIEARTNIWKNKMKELPAEDAEKLAGQFDFSGGEIDNIVRKCEMNEIISGKKPDYNRLVELCKEERLVHDGERHMGFGV